MSNAMRGSDTLQLRKLAWIRNPEYPAGIPAPGHFNCPCGNIVPAAQYGGDPVPCLTCGALYDGEGWILREAGDAP